MCPLHAAGERLFRFFFLGFFFRLLSFLKDVFHHLSERSVTPYAHRPCNTITLTYMVDVDETWIHADESPHNAESFINVSSQVLPHAVSRVSTISLNEFLDFEF